MTRSSARHTKVAGASMTLGALVTACAVVASPAHAEGPGAQPDLVSMLSGYTSLWQSSGKNDLHGTVVDAAPLQRDDRLTSWINQHATAPQRFRALQNAAYTNKDGSGYDQSMTIADGLGSTLGQLYVEGRLTGKLPLTTALVNSETGTAGAFVSTGTAKKAFSHPRPFLLADPAAKAVAGDAAECAPSAVNSSSLATTRAGKPWADAAGNLLITRVPDATDTTHAFAPSDVTLSGQYGEAGICTGGSFPSGHTTTAYQAGITLATLLPEVAPSILARASEAGNNRIVLGVHYPLDIVGGRMSGEAALAARWSDPAFRTSTLEPARQELVSYLTQACTAKLHVNSLQACVAADKAYTDNPYGGAAMPGGSAQIVTGRASALAVYTERMSYGFTPTGSTTAAPVVPAGAADLLRTAFPTLTDAQRAAVIAQTESRSGQPLAVGSGAGWQRMNLAAALSATVRVNADGSVSVTAVGGMPTVIGAAPAPSGSAPAPTSGPSGAPTTPGGATPSDTAPSGTTPGGATSTAPANPGSPSPAMPSQPGTGPVVQTDHTAADDVLPLGLGATAVAALTGAVVAMRRRMG